MPFSSTRAEQPHAPPARRSDPERAPAPGAAWRAAVLARSTAAAPALARAAYFARPAGDAAAVGLARAAVRSGGEPVPPGLRAELEPRLSRSLNDVRLHGDPTAASAARALGARAFTVGTHVAFARGRFDPRGAEGKRLLAHELAHAVAPERAGDRSISRPGDPAERHADRVAEVVESGGLARGDAGPARAAVSLAPDDDAARRLEDVRSRATSAAYGRSASGAPATWGWGAPETSNLYQECRIAELPRPDFLLLLASLPPEPARRRGPGPAATFGITVTSPMDAVPPAIATEPADGGGVRLKPTHAEMPSIVSAVTAPGVFEEGTVKHFAQSPTDPCPTAVVPNVFTVEPGATEALKRGEAEHCADYRYAFDVTLGRYASEVNALAAANATYRDAGQAEAAVERRAGPLSRWWSLYPAAIRRSLDRDAKRTHEPVTTVRKPEAGACQFRYRLGPGCLPSVGTTSPSDLIDPVVTAAKP